MNHVTRSVIVWCWLAIITLGIVQPADAATPTLRLMSEAQSDVERTVKVGVFVPETALSSQAAHLEVDYLAGLVSTEELQYEGFTYLETASAAISSERRVGDEFCIGYWTVRAKPGTVRLALDSELESIVGNTSHLSDLSNVVVLIWPEVVNRKRGVSNPPLGTKADIGPSAEMSMSMFRGSIELEGPTVVKRGQLVRFIARTLSGAGAQVVVYGVNGRVVQELGAIGATDTPRAIDWKVEDRVPAGVYFGALVSGDVRIATKRVVIVQ